MSKLSRREVRTIQAVAEVLIPAEEAFPLGHQDVAIIPFVENYLNQVPLRVKVFIRFNLWLIEYFSWITIRSPWIFSKMKFSKREMILDKLRKNKWFAFRSIYMLISILLMIGFYRDPHVMDAIGYTGYKSNTNKYSLLKNDY